MANIVDQITVGDVLIMVVDADPAASAGTAAPISSTAFFNGSQYIKTAAGDTSWLLIPNISTDLAAYLKLAGRAGGQTAIGGTAASENLVFQSTSHATKGKISFGSAATIDEANTRFGLGTLTPLSTFHLSHGGVDFMFQEAAVSTAGATLTPVGAFATVTDASMLLRVFFIGTDIATGNSVGYVRTARIVNIAGTVTVKTVSSDFQSEDTTLAACNVSITASGTDVVANVRGVAATDISWKVIYQVVR